MRSIFNEAFIAAAVGLFVLVLSAVFPTLAEQFEAIAPAVVIIVGTIIGALLTEQVVKTNAAARVQVAQAYAATSQRSAPHSQFDLVPDNVRLDDEARAELRRVIGEILADNAGRAAYNNPPGG